VLLVKNVEFQFRKPIKATHSTPATDDALVHGDFSPT